MNGFITRALAVCCTAALAASGGCYHYRDLVDSCWPQRYNYQARQETLEGFAGQVGNGHVLDQTVWNYHFESGTDKLTPGGMEHLAYLARRRPCPDPVLYLQTAHDIPYDAAAPDKYVQARNDLNTRRTVAIQKWVGAYTAERNLSFAVFVHNPYEVGMHTVPQGLAVQRMYQGSQGMLPSLGSSASGGGGSGGGR